MKIGSRTSVAIEDKGTELKSGNIILDDNGISHKIVSVGMSNDKGKMDTTNILVDGELITSHIFVDRLNM